MKKVCFSLVMVAGAMLLLSTVTHAFDISSPLFHSGITRSGHSGLLFTKGGTSLPEGKFFAALTPDYFDRDVAGGASEKVFTIPLTLTYGLPYNIEAVGKISYVSKDNGKSESGVSDVEISMKWSFLQQEGGDYPSLAAGLAGRFAVANESKGLSDEKDFGVTFFLSGTALVDLGPYDDYAFSLYGDAGVVLNDWGKDNEEKHGEYSAGVLLPIPYKPSVGFLLEFSGTVNNGWSRNEDFVAISPALRFNHKNASFTGGVRFVNPEPSGEDSYVDIVFQIAASF